MKRPDIITNRPDNSRKDVKVTSSSITRNVRREVDTLCEDGKYRYDIDPSMAGNLVRELSTMGPDVRGQFWKQNKVEIFVDLVQFELGQYKEVDELITRIALLGQDFSKNVQKLHITLDLLEIRGSYTGVNIYEIPSVKAVQKLAQKLKLFKSVEHCIANLQIPSFNRNLHHAWLEHAVPFKLMPLNCRLHYQDPTMSTSEPIRGSDLEYVREQAEEIHRSSVSDVMAESAVLLQGLGMEL